MLVQRVTHTGPLSDLCTQMLTCSLCFLVALKVFSSFRCYKSELVCTDEWSTNATLTLCWSLFSIRQASCHSVLSAFFCFQKIMCNSKHVCTHSFVKSLLTHRFLHTVFVCISISCLSFWDRKSYCGWVSFFPFSLVCLSAHRRGRGTFVTL